MCFCLAMTVLAGSVAADERSELPAVSLNRKFQSFVENYCVACHNGKTQNGDVRLDNLSTTIDNAATAQLWRDVLDILNVGTMPPEDATKRPDDRTLAEAIGLLTDDLMKARKVLTATGGETVSRRLNEVEYINSIKAVTGITISDDWVPDDENGEDFNTLGWYQTFSPATLETYELAAEYALRRILIEANRPYLDRTIARTQPEDKVLAARKKFLARLNEAYEKAMKVPKGADPTKHGFKNRVAFDAAINPLHRHNPKPQHQFYIANPNTRTGQVLYNMRAGPYESMQINREADFRGEYIFRARIAAEKGMAPENRYLILLSNKNRYNISRKEVVLVPVYGTLEEPQEVELRYKPVDGEADYRLATYNRETGRNGGERAKNTQTVDKGGYVPGYWIDWVELEGPIYDDSYRNKRRELLLGKEEKDLNESVAADIFRSFARTAFRGAHVPQELIDNLVRVYRDEVRIRETKTEALIKPMAVVLTSPQFLYHGVDKSHLRKVKGQVDLAGHEMAARLSYMFWKEPPSAELLGNSARLLRDAAFLDKTIDDMLTDPRSDQFYNEFFRQWLGLTDYDGVTFDQRKYPFFDDVRRYSVKQQAVAFIRHTVDNDLSMANLIDSDYTMVDSTMGRLRRRTWISWRSKTKR